MATQRQAALVVGVLHGIGRQVATDLVKNGYEIKLCTLFLFIQSNLVILAVVVATKSTSGATSTHPFSPGPKFLRSTIRAVERETREAGRGAIATIVDFRNVESIERLVARPIVVGFSVLVPNVRLGCRTFTYGSRSTGEHEDHGGGCQLLIAEPSRCFGIYIPTLLCLAAQGRLRWPEQNDIVDVANEIALFGLHLRWKRKC
jgi:hypothetical protein